jgi:hypothetical protein
VSVIVGWRGQVNAAREVAMLHVLGAQLHQLQRQLAGNAVLYLAFIVDCKNTN